MPHTQSGLPFAKGSHTSFKAADSQDLRRRSKNTRQLVRILASGPATDHELASALRLPLQSICSLRNGVVHAGLVERRAEIKSGPYGKDCTTWGLTAAGYAAVAKLEAA
jgi:hypothetical protein